MVKPQVFGDFCKEPGQKVCQEHLKKVHYNKAASEIEPDQMPELNY